MDEISVEVGYEDRIFFRRLFKRRTSLTPSQCRPMFQPVASASGPACSLLPLNLSRDWAYQIVTQVGNYGESFDRHLGKGSPIKLKRGLNDLWTEGGLMYAMPFR